MLDFETFLKSPSQTLSFSHLFYFSQQVRPVFEHGDALVGSGAPEIRAAVASFGAQALGGGGEEEEGGAGASSGSLLGDGGVTVSGASKAEL